jgi:hypothetical protein
MRVNAQESNRYAPWKTKGKSMLKSFKLCMLSGIVAGFAPADPGVAQTPPSLGLRLFADVNINSPVGSTYVIQYTPDLAQTNSWTSKVIRGGAWDAFEEDCRSGRRLTKGVSLFISDFILGFRVVLVTDPL